MAYLLRNIWNKNTGIGQLLLKLSLKAMLCTISSSFATRVYMFMLGLFEKCYTTTESVAVVHTPLINEKEA